MADATHKHGEHGGHGIGRYVAIWLILLAMTVITVVTGKMHLPGIGIYLAMAIATFKASLVVLYFMHLKDSGAVNKGIFVLSVVFVGVLIIGVFGDFWARYPLALPSRNGPAEHVDNIPPLVPHGAPAGEH